MPKLPLNDRTITCPHCCVENTLIGSDLPADMEVYCSNCGEDIGPFSDMHDSFVELGPPRDSRTDRADARESAYIKSLA